MTQLDLVEECLRRAKFDGFTYDPTFDRARLGAQMRRVFEVMEQGTWLTLEEISLRTGDHSQAAISARL